MGISMTYSYVREHFAEVLDEVENSQEPAIIRRRGHQDVALIPADELASLRETAYLLRSPQNAARLLSAMTRARKGSTPPTDLATLRRELGLEDER